MLGTYVRNHFSWEKTFRLLGGVTKLVRNEWCQSCQKYAGSNRVNNQIRQIRFILPLQINKLNAAADKD